MKPKVVSSRTVKLLKEIEKLRDQIEEIRKQCEHDWEYDRDPSGNGDTGYFCHACGSWRDDDA